MFYVAQLSEARSMCSTRHSIGNKKGARHQIGEDLLRLGKGSLWEHFAAPPHSPKSLVLWTPIKFFCIFAGADKWKAVIIGAGFSGLDMAIKLKEIGVHFTILEKSSQLGGTWFDNQYPGAACDIASHLYSLSYYLNPWWTRAYSR